MQQLCMPNQLGGRF
uniref:Uncharacterized protein n=1 Tax=Arundo donax TaxID=35708 RepID=A0A0A9A008_ARUDO